MNIGNGESTTVDDAQHVYVLLNDFVREYKSLYTIRHCSSNVHTMQHAHLSLKSAGPFYLYSTFFFENVNRVLKSLAHGTIDHNKQLISHLESFRVALIHYESSSYPNILANYCNELIGEKKQRKSTSHFHLTRTVKSYEQYNKFFSGIPNLNYVDYYDSVIYNNLHYETHSMHRKTTDDSCVMFKQMNSEQLYLGFIAAIITVNQDKQAFYFLINNITIRDLFRIKYLDNNGTKHQKIVNNAWNCEINKDLLMLIRPQDVEQKLVHRLISTRQVHVFRYPNLFQSS
ncbi:unnamed protein product [Didymodactylos carnosus]|uniref:Uncharacterized protein n=1 Tax=Didymodactylos carnosus TaxID=1234261 RepID=A0A815CPN2_9BILA|nr:unnamed protein product [Didymodactylos carnosus]CAF4087933.1 unnamed protein product [Didymodactylos carnosus]